MPDFKGNFVIETDASDIAVGAVLMQYDRTVAFISKALSYAQCNFYTIDHEILVTILEYKKWYPYWDGKKTTY